ncbi:MAG: hypothetical protein NUK65_11235 [Firmicutes bacterium]|nr:hypothetical protein [Bacillota bacterium]
MVIQITVQDLMYLLISALAIVSGIFLISILWNIKKVVSNVRSLLENNHESLKKTIKVIPGIIDDVEQISGNVRDSTDKIRVSLPIIIQEVAYVTTAAKGSIEVAGLVMENLGSGINETVATYKIDSPDFIANLRIIEEVIQVVYRTFFATK